MGRGIEDYDSLTLSTLGNGALEEKFQVELDRVLRNMEDPNTVDGKCEVTLKITFIPHTGNRQRSADMVLASACKLQPDNPVASMAYLGKQGARPMAWEHNPEQFDLPMSEGDVAEVKKTTIGGVRND